MKWSFAIQSPTWVPWVFAISLAFIVLMAILFYRWAMRKDFFVFGDSDNLRRYGPIRIRPFLDSMDLGIKDGIKVGTLSRKPGYIIKLTSNFVFDDGRKQRKAKIMQGVNIVSQDNTESFVFKLVTRKEMLR